MEMKGQLHITWSRFDNKTSQREQIPTAQDFRVPGGAGSSYLAADIWRGDDKARTVTVYLRITDTPEVVGVDRAW
jgi:hypothetical protein